MANGFCRSCGHDHPTTSSKGVTRISGDCDQCDCKNFRHGTITSGPRAYQTVQVNTFTVEQMKAEQDTSLDLQKQIIAQQIETRVILSTEQRKSVVAQVFLNEATEGVKQLRTIARGGYSPHTHPAIVNGLDQLALKLESALASLTR